MPVTSNRSFCIPNTGDLPAAWGTSAINPNFQYLDALFGGVTTIALGAATSITLTVPPTTGTSSGTVTQSQNAVLRFTGTQSGNAVIGITMPGYYIVDNRCTGGFYVQLSPGGGGNRVGAPNGQKCHVFYDGTDMDYVNAPPTGTSLDLVTNTTTLPPWMLACTASPYLVKAGQLLNISQFPALAQLLGSTYGGDGVTTFGLPDEQSRFRLSFDFNNTGRVTSGGSGVNGRAFGGSGGSQFLQQHNHTSAGHVHPTMDSAFGNIYGVLGNNAGVPQSSPTTTVLAFPNNLQILSGINTGAGTAIIANAGTGGSQNVPPAIVCTLPLIKT